MVTLGTLIGLNLQQQIKKQAEVSYSYRQLAQEKAHSEAISEDTKRRLFPEQYKPKTSSLKPLKGWRPRVGV